MHNALAQAVRECTNSPEKSQRQVARELNVAPSTLNDGLTGRHLSSGKAWNRSLSLIQEDVLIAKINDYASRGTLLTPRHVRSLAEGLAGKKLDKDWVGRFVSRHPDRLSSRFHTYHDLSRRQADTAETRKAWYNLVKEVYDTGLYTPAGIFNMDETYFTLSYTRRVRRIGPPDHPREGHAAPGQSEHITVVAAVGINTACIPPLVIYKGKSLQEQWFPEASADEVARHATVTDSGWTNSFKTKQWLEKCFDPATRDRVPPGRRRLLFLDGADAHDKVDFLEACWDRNIVVIIMPARLTDQFQPLDVDIFNHVKAAYFRRLDDYQLATGNRGSPPKGLFWGWFHEAWREAATSRQIRSAWRKAGLWPLDAAIIQAEAEEPATPPPQAQGELTTPRTIRTLRSYSRQLRRGEIDTEIVTAKVIKGLEMEITDHSLTRHELEVIREAQRLEKVARGHKRKVTHPQGQLYDMEHQEEHAQELADRKASVTSATTLTPPQRLSSPHSPCTPTPTTQRHVDDPRVCSSLDDPRARASSNLDEEVFHGVMDVAVQRRRGGYIGRERPKIVL